VNETAVDHLEGISKRYQHPAYAEPEVALLFQKNEFDTVPMDVIEVNLIDAFKSVSIYIQYIYLLFILYGDRNFRNLERFLSFFSEE